MPAANPNQPYYDTTEGLDDVFQRFVEIMTLGSSLPSGSPKDEGEVIYCLLNERLSSIKRYRVTPTPSVGLRCPV